MTNDFKVRLFSLRPEIDILTAKNLDRLDERWAEGDVFETFSSLAAARRCAKKFNSQRSSRRIRYEVTL